MSFAGNAKESVRTLLSGRLKRHFILAGPLRGASIYTSWHDYPGAILGRTEGPLLEWFQRRVLRGETWLDIGAHYGYTAIALSRLVGPGGRVVAFEPVLSSAACIARTRQLNGLAQLQVIPLGLSSAPQLEPRRLPTVRGMADSTIVPNGSEQVILIASLDCLWPSLCAGSPGIHGIKIDVQGMELDVLRGMRETLGRHQPTLVIEFHTGVNRRSVLDTLAECRYTQPGEPIASDEDPAQPQYRDNFSYAFGPGLSQR
jgi:FkbM family methyltransferase